MTQQDDGPGRHEIHPVFELVGWRPERGVKAVYLVRKKLGVDKVHAGEQT